MISLGLVHLIASRGALGSSIDRLVATRSKERGAPSTCRLLSLPSTALPGLQPVVARPHAGRQAVSACIRRATRPWGLSHLAQGYEDHHRTIADENVPLRNVAGCYEAS
jgi:hypothetical protein